MLYNSAQGRIQEFFQGAGIHFFISQGAQKPEIHRFHLSRGRGRGTHGPPLEYASDRSPWRGHILDMKLLCSTHGVGEGGWRGRRKVGGEGGDGEEKGEELGTYRTLGVETVI